MAGALSQLGTRHALVVCGRDGQDEISLAAPTQVREIRAGVISAWEWTPAAFGLATCDQDELCVESPKASATVIRSVLDGADGPAARVVVANAAAALIAADRVDNLVEGVAMAREALAAGRARSVLDRLVACSNLAR
jgi:anthranilate phosphoribosyltransferase